MDRSFAIPASQLAHALQSLGVNFILAGPGSPAPAGHTPATLLASLAACDEARLRLALIPLFLQHPEFSSHVCQVASRLAQPARLTLQCYYTAAVWLERIHLSTNSLPDFFSAELGLQPGADPETNLRSLAGRQAELSGAPLNWLGTYRHAAQVWLNGLAVSSA